MNHLRVTLPDGTVLEREIKGCSPTGIGGTIYYRINGEDSTREEILLLLHALDLGNHPDLAELNVQLDGFYERP